MPIESPAQTGNDLGKTIKLPAPTAWPVILAFGMTLIFSGLLTTPAVSFLGMVLAVIGGAGWFSDVLPLEKYEVIQVLEPAPPVTTRRPAVARVEWITHELHRARLPLAIYPVSAGVKGGLAGSVAMAVLAMAYGLIANHSLWYPINLLAVGLFPGEAESTAYLNAFHLNLTVIASIIHLMTSLLVGMLYGAMLPMVPRRPVLFGGVVAPILWSGLIHSVIEFLNPVLNRRINWLWFVITQVGFGIVAGIIVSKHEQVPTWQHLPFAVRAGFETQRPINERGKEDEQP